MQVRNNSVWKYGGYWKKSFPGHSEIINKYLKYIENNSGELEELWNKC